VYTLEQIKSIIENNQSRLFFSYSSGRPDNWSCDTRTREIICISVWLNEELSLIQIDDAARIAQISKFNRLSRSYHDVYALALEVINDAVNDNNVDRNRIGHRRWG
jgi:hypothetical protein